MLEVEARWLARQLALLPPSASFPLLDLGSSGRAFREEVQPWIEAELFAPLRARGLAVVHADAKDEPGVDLVGDLRDPGFARRLRARGFRSVLAANLLEHVPAGERGALCASILALVPPGGHLLVTAPRRYPWHPDPIDTWFRPGPAEIAALFPGTTVVASAVLDGGSGAGLLLRRPRRLARIALRLLAPWHRPADWAAEVRGLPALAGRMLQSVVVLRREA